MQALKYLRSAAMLIGLSATAQQGDLERLLSLHVDGERMMKIDDILDSDISPAYMRAFLEIQDSQGRPLYERLTPADERTEAKSEIDKISKECGNDKVVTWMPYIRYLSKNNIPIENIVTGSRISTIRKAFMTIATTP